MQHLLEVLKIVEGALSADRSKVASYAEQLAGKLDAEGNTKAASRIRHVLGQRGAASVGAASATTHPRLPVDGESRFALADEVFYSKGEVEVFLDRRSNETIEEFLSFVRASDLLLAQGVGISPSLLLYGPPGCGKTLLAKHVASELGLPLITARADSLVSSFLGSTAKNIRLLFEHASARPCVLFLDEFDAIAKVRDDKHELGELKRVVVGLLQNIDALDTKTVLLAATNHEHLLDPAVWRRFAHRMKIDLPDSQTRAALITHVLGNFGSQRDVSTYAEVAEGLSGADIRQVVDDAKRSAVLAGQQIISPADLLKRLSLARLRDQVWPESVDEQIRRVRELDPKAFTVRRLAEMYGKSTGHVSNVIRRGE